MTLTVATTKERLFTYKGGYSAPQSKANVFYELRLTPGSALSITKTANSYVVQDLASKSKTRIPLDHKGNLTKFLVKYCKPLKTVGKNEPRQLSSLDPKLSRLLTVYLRLYSLYRTKFPAVVTPAHIKVFEQGRTFSGVRLQGSTTVYRGTKLRGESYRVGSLISLTHARPLMSWSGKLKVAVQFATGVTSKVRGTAYVLKADVKNEDILVSSGILNAISRKLNNYSGVDDLKEAFRDEGYDLSQHEDEYFVLCDKLKTKVVKVYS